MGVSQLVTTRLCSVAVRIIKVMSACRTTTFLTSACSARSRNDSKCISLEPSRHRLNKGICYKCQVGLLGKEIQSEQRVFLRLMLTRHSNVYERMCFSSLQENSTCKGAMFGTTADTDTKEWSSYAISGQSAAKLS